MRISALFPLLGILIAIAGCEASVRVPPGGSGGIGGGRHVNYLLEREPNNTDFYANYIPGFPFPGVRGHCGAFNDTVDKFYFELTRSGTVYLTLSVDDWQFADLDLALEDSHFEIASSEGYGRYESINRWLTPGLYYISVFSPYADGGSGYLLTGDFTRGTFAADDEGAATETTELPLKRVKYTTDSKPAENIS